MKSNAEDQRNDRSESEHDECGVVGPDEFAVE